MPSELYLTAEELEQLTGTPAATFRWWATQAPESGPPSHRLGRRRVWPKDAAMKWLADQARATTTNA